MNSFFGEICFEFGLVFVDKLKEMYYEQLCLFCVKV